MPKKVSSKKVVYNHKPDPITKITKFEIDKPKSTKKPSWWKEHQEFLKKFTDCKIISNNGRY